MKGYVILAVAAASVAACATVDPQPSASSQDDKAYVTGSRIPVKSGAGAGREVQSIENRQGIDAMTRSPVSSPPPGK
ncbi:MAG TPA: hypothetical protein VL742_15330 [Casimicrobiaceae bacterium]|nr:hypothetical protein [Casimicrobiaceae bacterium]